MTEKENTARACLPDGADFEIASKHFNQHNNTKPFDTEEFASHYIEQKLRLAPAVARAVALLAGLCGRVT